MNNPSSNVSLSSSKSRWSTKHETKETQENNSLLFEEIHGLIEEYGNLIFSYLSRSWKSIEWVYYWSPDSVDPLSQRLEKFISKIHSFFPDFKRQNVLDHFIEEFIQLSKSDPESHLESTFNGLLSLIYSLISGDNTRIKFSQNQNRGYFVTFIRSICTLLEKISDNTPC